MSELRFSGWRWLFRFARRAHRQGWQQQAWYRLLAEPAKRLLFSGSPTGVRCRTVRIDGLVVHVPYNLAKDYFERVHEPQTRAALEDLLPRGGTVVDVGANIGLFTLLGARRVGPEGRVFAVEPGPDNLEILRRNVAANGFGQVTVLPVAAGGSHRERLLHLSPVGTIHTLYPDLAGAEAGSSSVAVDQVRLDQAIPGRPDVVKIDVEGAELEVLEGMSGWLDAGERPTLLVEWNPRALRRCGCDPATLPARLRELGYGLRLLDAPSSTPGGVDEVVAASRDERLPDAWYANLMAKP